MAGFPNETARISILFIPFILSQILKVIFLAPSRFNRFSSFFSLSLRHCRSAVILMDMDRVSAHHARIHGSGAPGRVDLKVVGCFEFFSTANHIE